MHGPHPPPSTLVPSNASSSSSDDGGGVSSSSCEKQRHMRLVRQEPALASNSKNTLATWGDSQHALALPVPTCARPARGQKRNLGLSFDLLRLNCSMHASIRGVDAKEREGEMVKEKRVIVPLSASCF